MKRKIGMLVVAAIVVIAVLLLKKQERPFSRSDESVSAKAAVLKAGSEVEKPISDVGLPVVEVKQGQKSQKMDKALVECLKKIAPQTSLGDFIIENKANIYPVVGDWYFQSKAVPFGNETSSTGKFLAALSESDFLDGLSLIRNDDHALELLSEVAIADSTNSAPLLFAAAIEKRRGNNENATKLIEAARQTQRFDPYISNVARVLFSSARNSGDLLQAFVIWSKLPVPDDWKMRKKVFENDDDFFAEQMTRQALDKNKMIPDIDWWALDYAVGKTLSSKKKELPSIKQLFDEKE